MRAFMDNQEMLVNTLKEALDFVLDNDIRLYNIVNKLSDICYTNYNDILCRLYFKAFVNQWEENKTDMSDVKLKAVELIKDVAEEYVNYRDNEYSNIDIEALQDTRSYEYLLMESKYGLYKSYRINQFPTICILMKDIADSQLIWKVLSNYDHYRYIMYKKRARDNMTEATLKSIGDIITVSDHLIYLEEFN